MKWKDLSLKERKQVYDNIRANNPDVTYFDIKEQFDSIPAYEDGKNSKEDQAWKIGETVRLAMQGRGVDQDSLQHIIDRVKMQNPPREYDTSIGAIEQGKKILHGLNNTVGAALTGASLGTMGLWNAARLLNIGSGSAWRLAAAKNALTGAKAGTVADVGNLIEDPTLTNAAQVGLSKIGSRDLTTTSNKVVNTINTGFDFDDITKVPAYEDGDDLSKTKKQLGLIPGTPEYFARQQAISGRVDMVQPEAYLTPAGYVKDALSVAEAIDEGNYGEAAATTLLNAIPWGVGKIFRGVKSKVGEALNTPIEVKSVDLAEPFTTAKRRKKSKVIEDDAQHKEAATRRSKNIKNYEKEISSTIEDAVFPDPQTMALLKYVDEGFGTNYKRSYADIAYRDMSNRGKYVTYEGMEPGHYGSMRGRKIEGDTYSINDFGVYLNPDYYMPGTASHELSHLADALNNPYTSTNMTTMKDTHYGNNYLDYLADYENMLSPEEIQKTGKTHLMGTRKYLSDPTEVKSHMIGLKRALINAGKLANWNSKVTVDMLKDYFDPRNYQNLVNPMNRNMFDLYRNKQGFVNRMNMLIPMEYAVPLGVSGFVGYELNDE